MPPRALELPDPPQDLLLLRVRGRVALVDLTQLPVDVPQLAPERVLVAALLDPVRLPVLAQPPHGRVQHAGLEDRRDDHDQARGEERQLLGRHAVTHESRATSAPPMTKTPGPVSWIASPVRR